MSKLYIKKRAAKQGLKIIKIKKHTLNTFCKFNVYPKSNRIEN